MKRLSFLALLLGLGQVIAMGPAMAKLPELPPKAPPKAPAVAPAKIANVQEFRARHSRALDLALRGDLKNASIQLAQLAEDTKLPGDERDRVNLSIGRIDYQEGLDEAALEAYRKIPQSSDSWLEALQERAWVEMRMGQPEKTIGTLKTVLAPIFKDEIRSEPYFTMALAQLRVCDYKAMYKTIEKFKKNFRPRISSWEGATDVASKAKLHETSETIQKMNLVEAEAIQHLSLSESGKRMGGKLARIGHGKDELAFPDTEGEETWGDELDVARVNVKGCPTSEALAPDQQRSGSVQKTAGKTVSKEKS